MHRIRKLQEVLQARDVDMALIMFSKDIFYFTGTTQLSSLVVTQDDYRFFVLRSAERARKESGLDVIQVSGFGEVLREMKEWGIRTLGIEEDVLPVRVYRRLVKLGCDCVDITPDILRMRSVKEPSEIEKIKMAAKQSGRALERVPEIVREGMTELELSAELEYTMRMDGHEGNLSMRDWNSTILNAFVLSSGTIIPGRHNTVADGTGLSPGFGSGAGRKKLKRGDVIWIDITGHSQGYVSDETRCFSIGKPPEKLVRAYEFVQDVYFFLRDSLREGEWTDDLFKKCLDMAEKRGYRNNFLGIPPYQVKFVGHGIGIELDEMPVISPLRDEIRENMTLSIEPKVMFPDFTGVGVESTLHITSKGGREITDSPLELIEI